MPKKNINMLLLDGTASGAIKCTLANWTGVAYKIPRTDLEKYRDRKDLKQTGVYFLFGSTESSDEKDAVYIGQASARKNGEGILYRLEEHKRNPEKDYWTEAIVITTSNNSFGPTEISYLEHHFCDFAKQARRYSVKNENDPTLGNVTEEKEAELQEFIQSAKLVIGTLGYKVFEPLPSLESESLEILKEVQQTNLTSMNLYMHVKTNDGGKSEAIGRQIEDGFVVFKGSYIAPKTSSVLSANLRHRRENAKLDQNRKLQEDTYFTSPSAAAKFVSGGSVSGLLVWKDKDGNSLKDLESRENNG